MPRPLQIPTRWDLEETEMSVLFRLWLRMVLLRQTGPSTDHGEIENCTLKGVVATRKDYNDYFAIALNVCLSLTVACLENGIK
jgi:hypothetical protein